MLTRFNFYELLKKLVSFTQRLILQNLKTVIFNKYEGNKDGQCENKRAKW